MRSIILRQKPMNKDRLEIFNRYTVMRDAGLTHAMALHEMAKESSGSRQRISFTVPAIMLITWR